MGILQKNMGMDAGQLLSLPEMVLKVISQADWRGLEHLESDERLAVMDLLFSAAGHALMAVFCEKLSKTFHNGGLQHVVVAPQHIAEEVRFIRKILVKAAPWDLRHLDDPVDGYLPVGAAGEFHDSCVGLSNRNNSPAARRTAKNCRL